MVNPYYDKRSAERLRSRNRKGRVRKGLWRLLIVLALAASGLYLVHHFQLYRIRKIEISGAGVLEAEVNGLMSPCRGRAFWRSGAPELASRVGLQFPAIKECRAMVLPWGWLWVRVRLRKPLARLDNSGSRVIDEEGVCFSWPYSSCGHLPLLDLAGSGYEGRMRAITALLASGGTDSCWVFEGRDGDNIRLRLPEATVLLGNGRFEEKWARLREILKNRETLPAPCIIDLRFHNQAIIRRTV